MATQVQLMLCGSKETFLLTGVICSWLDSLVCPHHGNTCVLMWINSKFKKMKVLPELLQAFSSY